MTRRRGSSRLGAGICADDAVTECQPYRDDTITLVP